MAAGRLRAMVDRQWRPGAGGERFRSGTACGQDFGQLVDHSPTLANPGPRSCQAAERGASIRAVTHVAIRQS
jgi:hypothetical protein